MSKTTNDPASRTISRLPRRDAGNPLARLVPLPQEKPPVIFGAWRDKLVIADNFDDPLPDDIAKAFFL
jgi:hypothetical protein